MTLYGSAVAQSWWYWVLVAPIRSVRYANPRLGAFVRSTDCAMVGVIVGEVNSLYRQSEKTGSGIEGVGL